MPEQPELTDKQIADLLQGYKIPAGYKLDLSQHFQWQTIRMLRIIASRLEWILGIIVIVIIFQVLSAFLR